LPDPEGADRTMGKGLVVMGISAVLHDPPGEG
jgi:hypothetical protein